MFDIIDITPLQWNSIGAVLISSGLIGLEREISGKPAGIRTSILVCLGTYAFVALSTIIPGTTTDASRVVGQIITGIGFLGAGVMFNKESMVQGVTSAAVIWILAAIGALIGFEMINAAYTITIITLLVLVGINVLGKIFKVFGRRIKRE